MPTSPKKFGRENFEKYWNDTMRKIKSSTLNSSLIDDDIEIKVKELDQKSQIWLDRIYQQHNEEGRYYHTTIHLQEMLEYLDVIMTEKLEDSSSFDSNTNQVINSSEMKNKFRPYDLCCIRFAIFFHDVVYNSKSTRNEKDSALLFLQFCADINESMNQISSSSSSTSPSFETNRTTKGQEPLVGWISKAMQRQVLTMIMATEKHQLLINHYRSSNLVPKEGKETPSTSTETATTNETIVIANAFDDNEKLASTMPCTDDEIRYQKLFLDLDMAVLGKNWSPAYTSYAYCIRQEYSFVPRDVYCTKRAEILTRFLSTTVEQTPPIDDDSSSRADNQKTKEENLGESKNDISSSDDAQSTTTKVPTSTIKPIYLSIIFFRALEQRARNNLSKEIDCLLKGMIPGEEN